MTEHQKNAVYHACRLAFNHGKDGGAWPVLLHTLREVLCPQHATCRVSEDSLASNPDMVVLLRTLREAIGELKN